MTKNPYNGWTNYESWNVALWIGNDEGSQRYWQEQAEAAWNEAVADKTFTREENAALDLMKRLESEFDDIAADVLKGNSKTGDVSSSWVADLLHAALSEVNCHEIAEHLLENVFISGEVFHRR